MLKSKIAACAALLSLVLPAGATAATICVLVMESGLGGTAAPVEATSAWEGGVMDALFDAGHIVCNAPVARMENEGKVLSNGFVVDPQFGVQAAWESGAEFLLRVSLTYGAREGGTKSARLSPSGVSFELRRLEPGKLIDRELKTGMAATFTGAEDARSAKALARTFIARADGYARMKGR